MRSLWEELRAFPKAGHSRPTRMLRLVICDARNVAATTRSRRGHGAHLKYPSTACGFWIKRVNHEGRDIAGGSEGSGRELGCRVVRATEFTEDFAGETGTHSGGGEADGLPAESAGFGEHGADAWQPGYQVSGDAWLGK